MESCELRVGGLAEGDGRGEKEGEELFEGKEIAWNVQLESDAAAKGNRGDIP